MSQGSTRKQINLRVCNQPLLPSLLQTAPDVDRIASSLLEHNKYLYLDLKECKGSIKAERGDGFRLLEVEDRLSSDSEEQAEVLNPNICITNLKMLCRGTIQMHQYLRMVRSDRRQQRKIKDAIKEYSSSKRIKTEPNVPMLTLLEPIELPHLKPFTTKESTADVRQYLIRKNHEKLQEVTRQKQRTLLNHHRKLSDFCRLLRKADARRQTIRKSEQKYPREDSQHDTYFKFHHPHESTAQTKRRSNPAFFHRASRPNKSANQV